MQHPHINKYLISNSRIEKFSELEPEILEKNNFSSRPKVVSHTDLANKVYKDIEETDKKEYKIITKDGKDYKNLSPCLC